MTAAAPSAAAATLDADTLRALRAALAPEHVLADPADCLAYAYDNSRRVALPQAVAFAADEDEIVRLVQVCRERRLPLTVRGRGTNTTGASVPVECCQVCGSEKLYRPSRRLVTAARFSGHAVCSAVTPSGRILVSTKLMISPAMIQPIVPHTRMRGNCRS